jgi:hypothetical protein
MLTDVALWNRCAENRAPNLRIICGDYINIEDIDLKELVCPRLKLFSFPE